MADQAVLAMLGADAAELLLEQLIVHTDRLVYTWKFHDTVARAIDPERCRLAGMAEEIPITPSALCSYIYPDTIRHAHALLCCGLHGGRTMEKVIHARLSAERGGRWYSARVSATPEGCEDRIGILSIRDITDERRKEAFYQRAVQRKPDNKMIAQMQGDLSADQILLLDGFRAPIKRPEACYTDVMNSVVDEYISPSYRTAARLFFSRETLMQKVAAGETSTEAEFAGVIDAGRQKCWMSIQMQLLTDPNDGHIHVYALATDVTEQHMMRQHLIQSSITDSLTGALNRATFESRVKHHLREDSQRGCLLVVDVDNFKHYNDNFGHQAGDQILTRLIRLLREHFRDTDLIGRLGGDEFLVFLPNALEEKAIVERIEQMLDKVCCLHLDEKAQICFSISVGCAYSKPGEEDYDALLGRADQAMYGAKKSGKNRYCFHGAAACRAEDKTE